MSSFFHGPVTGFDIESTGVNPFEDRIVTFSMVYSASPDSEPVILEWLIDPGIEIDPGASEVHGITTEYARENGQKADVALRDIASKIASVVSAGIPFVVYNAPFDTTMLWAEFERYGIDRDFFFDKEHVFSKVIDPLVIDKAVDRYRKGSRKLTDTARLYGYDLTNAHESTADVLATIHITRALKDKFQPAMTLELLQQFQKEAKAEQSESFQAYLRRKENDDTIVINGEWPIQTMRDEG